MDIRYPSHNPVINEPKLKTLSVESHFREKLLKRLEPLLYWYDNLVQVYYSK